MSAPECAIPGCSRVQHALGWCNAHYQRWRATGSPTAHPTPTERLADKAEDLLFLLSCGEPLDDALRRVDWTAGAAYRWACRHDHQQLRDATCLAAGRSRKATCS